MKKHIIWLFLLSGLVFAGLNQTPDRIIDVTHSKINIRVDLDEKKVSGKVTHTITPLRKGLTEIFFHAEDIDISDVRIEERGKVNYNLDETTVNISLDYPLAVNDTVSVTLTYEAYPTRGLYFVTPDSAYPNKHAQAWTQGEDTDNHFWVPIYDYPNERATFEVILNVDKPYTALSNGKLVNVSENSQTRTFHWKEGHPMVPYLISFVVGEYKKVEQNLPGLPIAHWVYPEHTVDDALRSFGKTPDMVKYFNWLTGFDYPYEKYDQVIVEDFMWGGMENITLSHQTDNTMHTENSRPNHTSDGLVAHELAHQWYGDLITTRNWSHIWLNEGFATFLTYIWTEHDLGVDDGEYSRLGHISSSIWTDSYNRRPTVDYDYTYSMELFNSNVYAKGSVILNMLRQMLGEDDFWRAIRQYTKDYKYKNVETSDLKKTIEEITGHNLYWFFDQWVFKPGYPEYKVSYKYDRWSKEVSINVKQTQDLSTTSVFKMPIDILVNDGNDIRKQVWVQSIDTSYVIPVTGKPKMVIFDEGFKILKKLDFEKPEKELSYQAVTAENLLDRIWAVRELGKKEKNKAAAKTLTNILNGYDHWSIKKEAASALKQTNVNDVDNILISAYSNQADDRVKREIVSNLSEYESASFLENIIFNEKNDYVKTSALSSLLTANAERVLFHMDTLMTIDSHNDRFRQVAVRYYGNEKNKDNYETLKRMTHYGESPWDIRSEVFKQFSKYWDEYPEVKEIILSHLDDPSYDVKTTCISVLSSKGDKTDIPHLQALMDREKMFFEECSRAIDSIKNRDKKPESDNSELRELKNMITEIKQILDGE